MSEEYATPAVIKRMRDAFEAANRRDFDAMKRFFAPDAVWHARPLGTSFEGRAAIRGFLEDWLGGYEDFKAEPEELLDLGGGVVLALVREGGRPVGTVGHVQQPEGWVFAWADGLVVEVEAYTDVDEGRAAAARLAEARG